MPAYSARRRGQHPPAGRRQGSAALVIGFLAVAIVVGWLRPGPGSAQELDDPIECPIAVPDRVDVDCGELVVPEDHNEPDGRQVRLPYIILRSPSRNPQPDPVVFTAGGPGYSSLDSVWWLAASRLLDDRDVIVFEQRGNRYAQPALTCQASVWWDETPGRTPCLDALRAAGVDITRYTTANIARDVVALREHLGYDQWNLYGSSFSTSVMLLVMEADPAGTRSVILQSVKPPNETIFAHEADSPLRAIELVFTACAADEDCSASYPNLAGDFQDLVRQLNEEPVEVEVVDQASGETIPISFDGSHFIDWIAIDQLYGAVFPHHEAAYLPLLIEEVRRGDVGLLEIAAQRFWSLKVANPNWAMGLMLAINCQQDLPAAGPVRPPGDLAASAQLDGFVRSSGQRAICAAWNLPPLAPAAADPIRSDRPALVLAGSFDPVTPPIWSRTTAEYLSNSTYVEFSGYGHDVTSDNPCADMLEAEFLADPMTELDTGCVDTAPGPAFVLPGDVLRAPGLARSGDEVSLGAPGGVAWIEAIAFVGAYGSVLLAVILPVFGLVRLLTRRRRHPATTDRAGAIAYALSVAATLAAVAVIVLVDRVTGDSAGRSRLVVALGPSRDLLSVRLLAWVAPVAGIVSLALVGVTGWAWIERSWSIGFRLLVTMSSLTTLAIVVLGIRWDLFTMLV